MIDEISRPVNTRAVLVHAVLPALDICNTLVVFIFHLFIFSSKSA